MSERWGATPEAWDQYVSFGLTVDLLPVVSNPGAEISEQSNMAALGKTPSRYNQGGKVSGFPKWTEYKATNGDIALWKRAPDYGICLQTRRVAAFDFDAERAQEYADAVSAVLDGQVLPTRSRGGSGRLLMVFRRDFALTKRVIPVEDGMIEILADGQQFVAEGTHPSGHRYEWVGLNDIPTLTEQEFTNVYDTLVALFATGTPRVARATRDRTSTGAASDDVADWLEGNWEVLDRGGDGELFIACPFASEHSGDSGLSSTAYFPAGTGGYSRGHFVCFHAHCAGRDDQDYLEATGYAAAQFDDIREPDEVMDSLGLGETQCVAVALRAEPQEGGGVHGLAGKPGNTDYDHAPSGEVAWPVLVRKKNGDIESTMSNMVAAIANGAMIGRRVAYDGFTDALVYAPIRDPRDQARWRNLDDATSITIRMELEQRGFKKLTKENLRDAIWSAATTNSIDSAVEWLNRQRWDGVSRVERFAIDCWGWVDTPYARAVGRYVWTALAGRTLEPGVRADMAPILVGAQGIKKTSAIQAMAPSEAMYAEIKLDERDSDQSRKLRGKVVGELEELRGLNTRAIEEIKAFVSRRRESWVPKFKEFESHFWRRCLLIGTTNEDELLADPTGERRWLPGRSHFIDLDLIRETRNQLWAEGAVLFQLGGVDWEDAERLAPREHGRYKIRDGWERAVARWLDEPQIDGKTPLERGPVHVADVLGGALGVPTAQQNRGYETRVAKIMVGLGLRRDVDGDRGFVR